MSFNGVLLSGTPGAGKSSLSDRLHDVLGWKQHSIGNLLKRDYRTYIQRNPSRRDLTFNQYYSDRTLVSNDVIKSLNNELRELILPGNILADSRFATLNAKGLPNIITVYLHAPVEIRAARNMGMPQYEGMGPREIIDSLLNRQSIESERGRELYGSTFDCHNINEYMLALNNEKMSIEQEADIILAALG